MATYYSVKNGDISLDSFGLSLSSSEVINSNTTDSLLLTSFQISPTLILNQNVPASYVALNTNNRNSNPSGTLDLTVTDTVNNSTFIDSSPNRFILTRNGNPVNSVLTPYHPNGWSAALIKTGDYLQVPQISFGTSDFTIETWVYLLSRINNPVVFSNWSTFGTGSLGIVAGYTGNITKYSVHINGVPSQIVGSSNIIYGKWTHIALTRTSGTFRLFVDGIKDATDYTPSTNPTLNGGGSIFTLGFETNGANLNGYFSNFRVLTGTSLYTTSNFTPSSSPLTNIPNTALLTLQNNRFRDNSTNNFTLTAVGTPTINQISPFTPRTYTSSIHSGSIFSEGQSYFSTGISNTLNLSGDFTMEVWIYRTTSNVFFTFIDTRITPSSNENYVFSINSSNQIDFINTNAGSRYSSTETIIPNIWNHVALVRNNNIIRGYINGVACSNTSTNSNVLNAANTTNPLIFNGLGGTPNGGYVSNFRIVKNQALYTTNFTPPTANLGLTDNGGAIGATATPILSNVSLLINNNGVTTSTSQSYPISSFASSNSWNLLKLPNALSGNNSERLNVSVKTSQPNQLSVRSNFSSLTALDDTRNNSVSSVSNTFTLSSVTIGGVTTNAFYLSGTTGNNWLFAPASPLFNLNGDFTIEFWINNSGSFISLDGVDSRRVISFGPNSTNSLHLVFWDGSAVSNKLSLFNNGNLLNGTSAVADGNWHHVAVTRYANTLKLFVDGGQSGLSVSNTTIFNTGTASGLTIGAINTNSGRLQGHIANLRIIKDLAVYTQPFTVPSIQSVSATPETVFLLKDGVINNFNRMLINEPLSPADYFSSAGLFDGSSSNLIFTSNAVSSLTGNFTIEALVYPLAGGINQTIIHANDGSGGGTNIWITTNNRLMVDNGTIPQTAFPNATININSWNHIAIVRNGATTFGFINGLLVGSNSYAPINNSRVTIGSYSGVQYFNGFISNVRIVKDQVLYTSNFTPPTNYLQLTDNGGATPSVSPLASNVALLTLTNAILKDNSIYNTTNIINNNVRISNLTDLYVGGLLSGANVENRNITADNFTLTSFSINHRGTVNFPLTSNKTLTLVGSAGLEINSGATLNIGTSSAFIPLSTTHTINLSNTQINVNDGGSFNVYGFPETTTTSLVSTHPIGSRVFTVTNTVSNNWRVGDLLAFKPNLSARTSFDTLTLSSFLAPNVFTTTSSSLCTHTGSADQFAFIPDVYNLTRNVIIQGSSSTNRGSITTSDSANTSINYAQLSNIRPSMGININNNSVGSTILSANCFMNDNVVNSNISFGGNLNSFYFDGINDRRIAVSSSSNFAYGTGNFTVEAWINPLEITTSSRPIYAQSTSGTNYFILFLKPEYLIEFRCNSSGDGNGTTFQYPILRNRWTHIALVRNGTGASNVTLYVDGLSAGSASVSLDLNNTTYLPTIGGYSHTSSSNFNGYISNLRVVKGVAVYTSNFTPPTSALSAIPGTSWLTLQNATYPFDNSGNNLTPTFNAALLTPVPRFGGTSSGIRNTIINNNIFYRSNLASLALYYNNTFNTTINNNYILSSANISLQILNLSGSINMSNNTTIGSLNYGTHLFNNSLTGTYGALNYNSALQGMIISGVNAGTIVGGGINSNREGVYVDASVSNLNNVTFQNIIANNNSNVGFKVSGNNLNYLTPVTLNINGLTANNNSDTGFEGYNITGNLSSVVANNNYIYGIETSIGNGNTIFDGVSTLNTNPIEIPLTKSGTTILSSASPFGVGVDSSIYFGAGGVQFANTTDLGLGTGNFTIELWAYRTAAIGSHVLFELGELNVDNSILLRMNGLYFNTGGSANTWCNDTSFPINQWRHIAVCRNNNILTTYINGLSTFSGNVAIDFGSSKPLSLGVGRHVGGTTQYFLGNISNFRVVKGVALYAPPSFTVQTTPLSVTKETTVLYNAPYGLTYKNSTYPIYGIAILSGYNYGTTIIKNALLSSASYLNMTALAISNINKLEEFRLEGSTLSATTPLLITSTRPRLEGSYLFSNCNSNTYGLSSLALTGYQSDTCLESGIVVMRENGLSGNHYRLNAAGKVSYDGNTVRTVGNYASEKLEPTSATIKLRSGSKYIPISTGQQFTVSTYVYKSAGYTGAAPRLILVGNGTLGFKDIVLATSVAANGQWESLTGNIPTSLTFGTFEVYVDCSGSVGCGSINIDDWDFS